MAAFLWIVMFRSALFLACALLLLADGAKNTHPQIWQNSLDWKKQAQIRSNKAANEFNYQDSAKSKTILLHENPSIIQLSVFNNPLATHFISKLNDKDLKRADTQLFTMDDRLKKISDSNVKMLLNYAAYNSAKSVLVLKMTLDKFLNFYALAHTTNTRCFLLNTQNPTTPIDFFAQERPCEPLYPDIKNYLEADNALARSMGLGQILKKNGVNGQ